MARSEQLKYSSWPQQLVWKLQPQQLAFPISSSQKVRQWGYPWSSYIILEEKKNWRKGVKWTLHRWFSTWIGNNIKQSFVLFPSVSCSAVYMPIAELSRATTSVTLNPPKCYGYSQQCSSVSFSVTCFSKYGPFPYVLWGTALHYSWCFFSCQTELSNEFRANLIQKQQQMRSRFRAQSWLLIMLSPPSLRKLHWASFFQVYWWNKILLNLRKDIRIWPCICTLINTTADFPWDTTNTHHVLYCKRLFIFLCTWSNLYIQLLPSLSNFSVPVWSSHSYETPTEVIGCPASVKEQEEAGGGT